MQISKNKLHPKIDIQIKKMFSQLIADIKNEKDAFIFLRDFLTPAELTVFAKRLAIITYLEKGKSYDETRKSLKVSSATIASVQAMLEKKSEGFLLALRFLKAEEWSQQWSQKIIGFLQNFSNNKTGKIAL